MRKRRVQASWAGFLASLEEDVTAQRRNDFLRDPRVQKHLGEFKYIPHASPGAIGSMARLSSALSVYERRVGVPLVVERDGVWVRNPDIPLYAVNLSNKILCEQIRRRTEMSTSVQPEEAVILPPQQPAPVDEGSESLIEIDDGSWQQGFVALQALQSADEESGWLRGLADSHVSPQEEPASPRAAEGALVL